MSTVNIFEKISENLRGRWTQGEYVDTNGNVCLLEAIRQASWDYSEVRSEATAEALGNNIARALVTILLTEYPDDFPSHKLSDIDMLFPSKRGIIIIDWNDAKERTEEDIHLLLKKASA
jgi:hypothetical protein